ncbi:MAG: polysaccharide deacetylase family protein [Candidatus Carbobacillus altaicus]|uniref:Polysaccharide deacetylase family protein n=1 Tax=Candidatus Carbonibacillus altaicus TaxID=2163959 RepID=A0A2R6Y3F9_9BACL|nr:polysaccharide deacetylase family protein [Candidatus Carbobacillus altaicus]PTQ57220.1 MAG: Polysaccharide deacetylase family protein [Candidatus Carbobacillus altaicus]
MTYQKIVSSLVRPLILGIWLIIITACGSANATRDIEHHTKQTEGAENVHPSADDVNKPSEKLPIPGSANPLAEDPHIKNKDTSTEHEVNPDASYAVSSKNYMLMPINDNSDKNVILITVDDAPQGESTEKLLDLFDTYHVKAIWFLNGIYAIKHPELVKEIHDHGHIIGNHSWSHPYLKKLSETETKEEIIKLNDWIEQTIGERPKYFRPPFGQMTDAARAVLAKENMQMMNWTWGSLDWELKSADKISENVLNHATPGTNYLFHDKNITVEAMKKILPALQERGFHFAVPTEVRPETHAHEGSNG